MRCFSHLSLFKIPVALLLAAAGLFGQGAEDLRITVGKSIVIDYPTDVARISTSDPQVVDAVAVSTREILLHGKALGVSTIVIWAKTGQRTFYNVAVEHNLEPIRAILKQTFPDETISIQSARDSVTLIGRVSTKEVSDRAAALVASLAKTVVNHLFVAPSAVDKQILLRVKFAELDRNFSEAFGVNLLSTGALNTPGLASTGQFSPPRPSQIRGVIPGSIAGTATEYSLADALNIFAFRPDLNLAATIRALQTENFLQILAEPNLITTNGKDANFLVGGEFPVPILQGGSNSGAVTVQFREFGIRLSFTPTLTANKTLKMFVRPEVSSIDVANSVTFGGFRIPALSTRKIETNIELAPGQSFVIGGLIDDRLEDTFNKVPGLAHIPILGMLFKSRAANKSRSELIVLVTPEVVDPLNPSDPRPMPPMPKEFLGPLPSSSGKKSGAAARNARLKGKEEIVAKRAAEPRAPAPEGQGATQVKTEPAQTAEPKLIIPAEAVPTEAAPTETVPAEAKPPETSEVTPVETPASVKTPAVETDPKSTPESKPAEPAAAPAPATGNTKE